MPDIDAGAAASGLSQQTPAMEDAAAPTCDSQMTDAANAALTEPPDDDASIHSSPADAGVEAAPGAGRVCN